MILLTCKLTPVPIDIFPLLAAPLLLVLKKRYAFICLYTCKLSLAYRVFSCLSFS